MLRSDSFDRAYDELESRFRALAESEDTIFLPNPRPGGPVDYVLICMEPSLGRWARSAPDAYARVAAGFRNFLSSVEDFILHLAARRFLCSPDKRYHVTDLSKGAMLVGHADRDRTARYDRWYGALQEELELVARPNAGIIAVGKLVAQHLRRRGFSRPFTQVIHYSGQAAKARKAGVLGKEEQFRAFAKTMTHADLLDTASQVLQESGMPASMRNETLKRLVESELSDSRLQLLFVYKLAFESLRRRTGGAEMASS